MKHARTRSISFGLLGLAMLTGCAAPQGSSQEVKLLDRQGLDVVAAPAGHSTLFIRESSSIEKFCLAPQPDAIVEADQSVSLGANVLGGKGASVGTGGQLNTLGLGGRSPNLLIVREVLYRTCEIAMNFGLSKKETLDLFSSIQPLLIKAVSSVEAGSASVSSTSSTPPALSADNSSPTPSTTDEGAPPGSSYAGPTVPGQVMPGSIPGMPTMPGQVIPGGMPGMPSNNGAPSQ